MSLQKCGLSPAGRLQHGSALAISLIILLIMTILGVQALSTTTLEEKMAGNYRDNQIAFEAAEAALRAGEAWLDTHISPPPPDASGTNGVWSFGTADIYDESFWSGISSVPTSFQTGMLYEDPKYVVEQQQQLADHEELGSNAQEAIRYNYKVTARGVGGSEGAVVILQTTYVRLF